MSLSYIATLFQRPAWYIFPLLSFMWDVDSLDWKDYDAATIIRRVTEHKHLGNGSIILCHNGAKHTAEALDELLATLKQKGYQLVPISELILKENYSINTEGRQMKAGNDAVSN